MFKMIDYGVAHDARRCAGIRVIVMLQRARALRVGYKLRADDAVIMPCGALYYALLLFTLQHHCR